MASLDFELVADEGYEWKERTEDILTRRPKSGRQRRERRKLCGRVKLS